MEKTGAWLVRYALEALPISHTFGIPGVHNTEIYDELNKSEKIEPVLVTHELSAAFMADGVSRTSKDKIGCLVVVPAAGVTHALSGIAEAFLDGIPLLVITGGIRTDTKNSYQLHDVNQHEIAKPVTKKTFLVKEHHEIVPTLFEAYQIAVSGVPGPVLVEIPVNIQLFKGNVGELPLPPQVILPQALDSRLLKNAAALLTSAKKPGLFVGWGARHVTEDLKWIAEFLGAPVSTTLQGMTAFPGSHPLHTGMGFSRASVPASEKAFEGCDALLAIGVRFSEIPTGSFGLNVPSSLIHLDIDENVFNKNYPAQISLCGDAKILVPKLVEEFKALNLNPSLERRKSTEALIKKEKAAYRSEWNSHLNERVNPSLFFQALRSKLDDESIVVVDDGNHTYLAAELLEVRGSAGFLSPTDFNAMGYCVPAAIGAKLTHPDKKVVGIVGDGAFLMTGMETLTATTLGLGVIYFIFHDGELSQISQGQEIPYNRKTCTVLGNIKLKGMADATGAQYLALSRNEEISLVIGEAFKLSEKGQPVLVDIKIDYSKRTKFTEGVVKTVLKRFPLGDKFRFIGRAITRKITG